MEPFLLNTISLKYDLPTNDRKVHLGGHDLIRRNHHQILIENHDIGQIILLDHAFAILNELRMGGSQSVQFDGLLHGEFLLGKPPITRFTGTILSRDGRI